MNTGFHKPTVQEVNTALRQEDRVHHKPQTALDIARVITVANGGSYAKPRVNQVELERILGELVKNGSVHCHPGQEWHSLFALGGLVPRGRYYALKEAVQWWEAEAAERREKKRLTQARERAAVRLVALHQTEYEELVAAFLAADTSSEIS